MGRCLFSSFRCTYTRMTRVSKRNTSRTSRVASHESRAKEVPSTETMNSFSLFSTTLPSYVSRRERLQKEEKTQVGFKDRCCCCRTSSAFLAAVEVNVKPLFLLLFLQLQQRHTSNSSTCVKTLEERDFSTLLLLLTHP